MLWHIFPKDFELFIPGKYKLTACYKSKQFTIKKNTKAELDFRGLVEKTTLENYN